MIIKLVRHGESRENSCEVNSTVIGDVNVSLTPDGHHQAIKAGEKIGHMFVGNSLVYVSPYTRTKQTLNGILAGSGASLHFDDIRIYEDRRLREIEFGYNKSRGEVREERTLRPTHGWMLYRYAGGESPADCYDRMCTFIESMWRQVNRKNANRVLIVSHGMSIRCFVARFLHLTLDQFDAMHNPGNCDIITVGDKNQMEEPVYTRGKWGMTGIRLREKLQKSQNRV